MSRESSSWQDLLDSFTKSGFQKGKANVIHQIRNDNAARVKKILEDDELCGFLIKWMNHQVKCEKTLEATIGFRESGNRQFSLKDYVSCIEMYTCSILSCPEDSFTELSLAFANRSAALFELELYEDCIKDIDVALSKAYPSHLLPKILVRKLKSLIKLGFKKDSEATLNELEFLMKNLQMSDKVKLESSIKAALNNEQSHEEDIQGEKSIGDILPYCGENPVFKSASNALHVKYFPDKGRFVVADKDIKAGETLFVEQPNALVVLPDFQNLRCHHCTRQSFKRYPCLSCGRVWFCSENCRTESNVYHEFECGLRDLLNSVGIAQLGLKVILIYGLETVSSFLENTENLVKIPGVDCPYDTESYQVMFHLVSHTERMGAEELYQYTVTAAFLTLLLEQRTDFFKSTNSNFRYQVGGLILKHICQMVSNAHAITEICSVDDSSERQERIATAIYPSASMMNHSCDPSVINSFQGKTLIVRAIRDIQQGDEVFNCYGPHYRRMRRSERLESLEAQYCFTCDCSMCQDENAEDFQDVIYSFKCTSCNGSLVNPNGKNSAIKNQVTLCRSCKTPQSYFSQLEADLEAISLDARGTEAMDKGDIIEAIKLLTKCVQLRTKALFMAHPDLGRSADKLAQCYAFIGKFEDCERALKISLTAVEHRYGRYSIEMANELQKFTDVLLELLPQRNQQAKDQLRKYLEEAKLIYHIHYGAWNSSYKELQEKVERLSNININ